MNERKIRFFKLYILVYLLFDLILLKLVLCWVDFFCMCFFIVLCK